MIDFSKDVQKEYQNNREKKTDDKKIHNRTDRNVHINYDFADRDVKTKQPDNAMIGRKVLEEEKTEKPAIVEKNRQKRRFTGLNDKEKQTEKDNFEMVK